MSNNQKFIDDVKRAIEYLDYKHYNHNDMMASFHKEIKTALEIAELVAGGGWNYNMDEAPKDQTFYVKATYLVPFKWKPYSPKSQQFKRGIKGRWQEMNEYGGWENTSKKPDAWKYDDDKPLDPAQALIEGA